MTIKNNILFKIASSKIEEQTNAAINKIKNKEIFNYRNFPIAEKYIIHDQLKKILESDKSLNTLEYLVELQNENYVSTKNTDMFYNNNNTVISTALYFLENKIDIYPLINFVKDLLKDKIEENIIYNKSIRDLYNILYSKKNTTGVEESNDNFINKIKKEFPSFSKWEASALEMALNEFSKNSFEEYSYLIYNQNSDNFETDTDVKFMVGNKSLENISNIRFREDSDNVSIFLLKKVYNNDYFFKQLMSDISSIEFNPIQLIGDIFDKIFFLIIKDKNLFNKYSYLLTSTSLNSGNFNYMNKLINLKRFIPSFDGIKKAISESKRPIPSKVFGLLFSLPINEINEVYSQKKKLIKTNLINLNNFPILKELYSTNNQILQLIISEYGKFAPSIEELLKDYLINNSKTPESLYNEVFKKDPTYLNKIVSLIKYKAPYISEFNSLNIKSNAQNIQQYIKIKSRQTDLAALIHNQEINKNLVPMLFNNSKLDLTEPYIDNLVSVINFANNKKEKINKFVQIQNKFKQKGFNINIQEFLDQLKESEKYVDEFETNNLNPSPRFIQLFKELATNISYVEMSDQINNYIRIAEKKDPNLFKLELNFDGYEFKVLKDLDPTHFRIGIDTDCCQRIGGAGSEAAIDSFINSQSGVLVLYYNSAILSQSYFHFIPQDNGFILDNIEYNKTEVQKIDKNIKDNQSLVLTEIYKKYAELLKEKYPEIKYLKLGKEQTKILTQEFKESELEEDPRRFKVDDPYTDFDESDHVDLF